MLLFLIASMDIVQKTSLQDFSYPPPFRGGAAAKDLDPWRRIVAYSAYIFKALSVTSAWGLCGMHPGLDSVIRYTFRFR